MGQESESWGPLSASTPCQSFRSAFGSSILWPAPPFHLSPALPLTMADSKLALSPREFSGDPATCVFGRVVIKRGPVEVGNQADGKGKGKAKGKRAGKDREPGRKIEVHMLG
eukprot:3997899-Pyramimonas_sp.AAC.1